MKIITVGTHNKGYYDILQESCKRNNLELINLGWEKEWVAREMPLCLLSMTIRVFSSCFEPS